MYLKMSQTSFLEEVLSWKEEKCRQNLGEALPKLILFFSNEEDIHREIGILKVLCSSFLPFLELGTADEVLFSKIANKSIYLVDKVFQTISDVISAATTDLSSSQQTVSGILELVLDFVDCYNTCVNFVIKASQSPELYHLHSLLPVVVRLLKGTYSHCKESTNIYNELLPFLTEPLSALFKKTHKLQMSLLNCLDTLKIYSSATKQDVEDLTNVCYSLFEVCKIVTVLDVKIVVSLWKAISRLAVQHQQLLKAELDVDVMVCHLCSEIDSGYRYLFDLVPRLDADGMCDEKAFQKSVRILGFQMKVVVTLMKEYEGYTANCEKPVYLLLLQLLRMMPPCPNVPRVTESCQAEIEAQVLNAIQPLLTSLLSSKQFRLYLTEFNIDLDPVLILPKVLLQIKAINQLPKTPVELQEKWLAPRNFSEECYQYSIVTSIFKSVELCYVELAEDVCLPGVMCSGKPQRNVSLYEYICTHLCGFVGSFPAKNFDVLERMLLENILHANIHCRLMACDVWCFLARYGSAQLCRKHYQVLSEVLRKVDWSMSSPRYFQVRTLLNRLFKFQAPEYQIEHLMVFPPSGNLEMWSDLSLTGLEEDLTRKIVDDLVPSCAKTLHKYCMSTEQTVGLLKSVILALRCLVRVCSNPDYIQRFMSSELLKLLVESMKLLWTSVPDSRDFSLPLVQMLLCLMLLISSALLRMFDVQTIRLIFTLNLSLLQAQPSDFLRLAVVRFLKECANMKLLPSFEQTQILSRLPVVFASVLIDDNCVVRHKALEAFAQFAEETVYEATVPLCLQLDNEDKGRQLQDFSVAFLNKMPHGCVGQSRLEYLKAQREILIEQKSETQYKGGGMTSLACSDEEPLKKKSRMEHQLLTVQKTLEDPLCVDECKKIVESFQYGMDKLCSIQRQNASIPDSIVSSMRSFKQQLDSFLDQKG